MPFVLKMDLELVVPASVEPAGDMPEKWASGLTTNAERMNNSRTEKIGSDGDYITNLSTPSSQGFGPMVNAGFVSRSGRNARLIRLYHGKNAAMGFNKYNQSLDKVFATVDGIVDKEFKERVNNAKSLWAEKAAVKTLRLTGDKIRGRGVAPLAGYLLTGYQLAEGWSRPGDKIDHSYNITKAGLEPALKAALTQRLVAAGLGIDASNYHSDVMTEQNQLTADILNSFRDPAKCDVFQAAIQADKNFCSFVYKTDDGLFYLHCRVGLTV